MIQPVLRKLMLVSIFLLLSGAFLSGCGTNSASSSKSLTSSTSTSGDIALENCQGASPGSTITKAAPTAAQTTLYIPATSRLFAVNASNGAVHWCQQLKITRKFVCPGSCPPPPQAMFGAARVVNGTVYICVSGYGNGYVYVFNASDGSLRWRAQTDCAVVSIPFGDAATPLVQNGIVYSGSYALDAQTGKVLWRVALDSQARVDGTLSLQALVNNVLYVNTEDYVYAIDAQNGHVLWRYAPDTHEPIAGPLLVSGQLLYVGALGDADHPEKSEFYALDATTGKVRWRYHMGDYQGATVQGSVLYVSARDQFLYALNKTTGALLWKRSFIYPTYNPAVSVGSVLYINIDGVYALNDADGSVIWHKSLGSSQSNVFTSSVVVNGVVYLASINGSGQSVLYALNASNGSEYWQSSYPYQLLTPVAVTQ